METVTRLCLSGNPDLNNLVILNLGYLFLKLLPKCFVITVKAESAFICCQTLPTLSFGRTSINTNLRLHIDAAEALVVYEFP